ncbi:hypothetical protein R1flu_003662 [Riccia fluitans]|uniref:Uncharacterized protein n=1 Tax=Riccia fluitans TaxID=41844 RepID=A0ABD1Y9M9_9MARC
MDKNKKKKAKRKAKAAAAATNAGDHSSLDHAHGPNRSGDDLPSLAAEENDNPSATLLHSSSETEPGKQENDQPAFDNWPMDIEETEYLQIFGHHRTDDREADVHNRNCSAGENMNVEHYECHQKIRKMEVAFVIQMARMSSLAQEKESAVRALDELEEALTIENENLEQEKAMALRELKELQEALVIEKETAELLRDQLTYLQGHIAEREVFEIGTQKQVQVVNAENMYLQGLVADLREKVQKLEKEVERAEEEQRKLADENQQLISKGEEEEGERVAELIKKIEKLEQERGDLEEKQNRLKQEGKQMIVRMEKEGEKMEQLSRQMVLKMDTERQILEQEIRQMSVKMEQEQENLEKERLQMNAQLQQERLKFNEENAQKTAHLTAEVEKLEKENRHLMLKLQQERETILQERNQMKSARELERNTLDQEYLLMGDRLNQERGQMELEYKQKREKLELDQEILEHNQQQVTAKLTALDTQLEQLEREASVRERVFRDLATVTEVDASKNWESWRVYGKDPLAEAVAVAEEARIQRMAMAQTVDKLLAENVELMEKVNQQTITINDLTKRMGPDVKASDEISYAEGPVDDAQEVIWRPEMETEERDSTGINNRRDEGGSNGFEHYSGKANGYSQGINAYIDEKNTYQNLGTSTGRYYDEERAAAKPPLFSVVESVPEASTSSTGRIRSGELDSSGSFTTLYEITEISDKDSSGTAELVERPQESSVAPGKSPGRASSVIKAPVRFLSFVAGYISGADLVKD